RRASLTKLDRRLCFAGDGLPGLAVKEKEGNASANARSTQASRPRASRCLRWRDTVFPQTESRQKRIGTLIAAHSISPVPLSTNHFGQEARSSAVAEGHGEVPGQRVSLAGLIGS